MKIKYLFCVLLSCICLSVSYSHGNDEASNSTSKQTASEKTPKIFIERPEIDIGTVVEGVAITHDFSIYNKGTAELKIESVRPG